MKGVPSELNAMLYSGRLDLCPSSSIAYAAHPEMYRIFRDLSISSVGKVNSVYLFSRYPIEDLDRQTVGLTSESETSVNLLKIILRKFYGHRNDFEITRTPALEALECHPAVLLIGDSALKAGLCPVKGIFSYDLGELWYRFTGLPFVFALWIVREDAVVRDKVALAALYARLRDSKSGALGMLEKYADSCTSQWLGSVDLIHYWRNISYDLSQRHMEGLRTFYRYSRELGLLGSEPDIRLFP